MPGDNGLLYSCKIARTNKSGRITIKAIPGEEFLTDRRALPLEDATFCAHRSRRTVTDLIEMGFDRKKVMSLPGGSELDYNTEKLERFRDEDEQPQRDADELDDSMRHVWVAECYLKVDYNGDGVAEWRKVIMAGGGGFEILENEECDGHPFSAWTPVKMPHKLYGESLADKTMDIQLIKSTIWRQTLDGMYFNNAPQLVVVEGQVSSMEDVLNRRPGGIIRVKSEGAVQPLPVQDVTPSGFQMLSYLDSVKETRTGIRRFTAGLEGDELNPYASTATGARMVEDSSQDALMLLARNFAEQGLKPLFNRMLELTCKNNNKPMTVKLRGTWTDIDPSTWDTKMNMTVAVGLGTGNRDAQVGHLMQMLTQIDGPLIQVQGGISGPILTAENIYNKLVKLTEAAGFRNSQLFYTDPKNAPPQPPKPDPNMAKVQGQLQLQAQKQQMDLQGKQHQAQLDAGIEQQKAQKQLEIEQAQAQADMMTQRQQATLAAQLEQQKAAHQAELDWIKMQNDMALQHQRALADIEIAKYKAQAQVQQSAAKAKTQAKMKPKQQQAKNGQ